MTSSTIHQAEPVSASERLTGAIMQAEMLCNIEGEQSEVCKLAKSYIETLRNEVSSAPSSDRLSENHREVAIKS